MFVPRRIFRKNQVFANFICTNNVLNCDKPKNTNEVENFTDNHNKKGKNFNKNSISLERKINNISDSSTEKSLSGEKDYTKTKNLKTVRNLFRVVTNKSVKNVAEELGGDVKKTTEEILGYLKELDIAKVSDSSKGSEPHMYDGETLGSLKDPNGKIFSQFIPLNIFDVKVMEETEPQVKLNIWNNLETEELQYLSKKSPKNWFEEMIVLTNEGKLWQFPIDNDQGMEKEAEISFTEHIFMEQYLEPWCPKKGPLRKFMELVLIGLSKNHIYTIEEKKAHIDWFRRYFEEKRKFLQELGAMGPAKDTKEIENLSIKENS